MNRITTFVLAVCMSMAAGAAVAQDAMKKDAMTTDPMKKDAMAADPMKK